MQQCDKGQEEEAALEWEAQHPSKQTVAFSFTYDRMKRYEGSWHLLKEPLFPGVFFLEAKEGIPVVQFGTGENSDSGPVLLDSETEEFLKELGGRIHHVPMSRGVIQNGVTIVTEGPLAGKECRIRKIDRHKRLARITGPVRQSVFGGDGFWTGLEITSKS